MNRHTATKVYVVTFATVAGFVTTPVVLAVQKGQWIIVITCFY